MKICFYYNTRAKLELKSHICSHDSAKIKFTFDRGINTCCVSYEVRGKRNIVIVIKPPSRAEKYHASRDIDR